MLNSVTASGGTLTKTITGSKFALFNLTPASITALSSNTNVKYATPNRALKRKLNFAQPAVNASIAWQYGSYGTGVGIAIVDSGIGQHGDFNLNGQSNVSRVVYSENFADATTTTDDLYGHGTHVAGVAAGNGMLSSGKNMTYTFKGIATNANLINLRVLDQNGVGSDVSVISAIYRAIALKSTYNIRVMNLSLGRTVVESYTLDPLCQALEDAWKAGIVVVVAPATMAETTPKIPTAMTRLPLRATIPT